MSFKYLFIINFFFLMSLMTILKASIELTDERSFNFKNLDLSKTDDINFLLDAKFKRETIIRSEEDFEREISSHIFDFIQYSIKFKHSKPISSIDLQLAVVEFFDVVYRNLCNFSDYRSFLKSCAASLKVKSYFAKIFSNGDIENLLEMLMIGSNFVDVYQEMDALNFSTSLRTISRAFEAALNNVKMFEPEDFGSTIYDFLSEKSKDGQDTGKNFFNLFSDKEDRYDIRDLSSIEALILIEEAIEAIQNNCSFEYLSPLLLNITGAEILEKIQDLVNFDELSSVLKMTAFEIRKHRDFIFSSQYRIDILTAKFKLSARLIIFNNFNKYISFRSKRLVKPIGMRYLLDLIFGDSSENYLFENVDIELTIFLIQEIVIKDSGLRKHIFEKGPFDYSIFNSKISKIIAIFPHIAERLNDEIEFDRLVIPINRFLLEESPNSIKEVIQEFAKFFQVKTYDSFDFYDEIDDKFKDEIAFCLDMGIQVDFSIAKDYVFNHILELTRDSGDKFSNDPWFRCFKQDSLDHLSTLGSTNSRKCDSDDDTDCPSPMRIFPERVDIGSIELNSDTCQCNEDFDGNFIDFDDESHTLEASIEQEYSSSYDSFHSE